MKKEKKIYEVPLLSVTEIVTEDIITTSEIQLTPVDANFIGKKTIEIDF